MRPPCPNYLTGHFVGMANVFVLLPVLEKGEIRARALRTWERGTSGTNRICSMVKAGWTFKPEGRGNEPSDAVNDGNALHRALSPTFPAGAMVFFIPSRGGAEGSGAAHLDRQTDPHPPPGWCSGC